jgi:hypothetical protein
MFSFSGQRFLASLRELAAFALVMLIFSVGSARAENYDLFKWCVTFFATSTKPHQPGTFETVVAEEKVTRCNYLREAPPSVFVGEE